MCHEVPTAIYEGKSYHGGLAHDAHLDCQNPADAAVLLGGSDDRRSLWVEAHDLPSLETILKGPDTDDKPLLTGCADPDWKADEVTTRKISSCPREGGTSLGRFDCCDIQ